MNTEIDKQHEYLQEYTLNAVEVGQLAEKYPGLRQAWETFVDLYIACKKYDEANN